MLKAMKKSLVYIMPRRHVQSSCSKWYHSHPLTVSTGPTLIPVRRQERLQRLHGDLKEEVEANLPVMI